MYGENPFLVVHNKTLLLSCQAMIFFFMPLNYIKPQPLCCSMGIFSIYKKTSIV